MTRIIDVAKKAGVSVSTVSKVLKNYPNVSMQTKEKVNAAIVELDYVPNVIASALSTKNYNRIAIWINFNNEKQAIDEINMQYLFGALSEAKKLGLHVLPVFSYMYSESSSEELTRYFRSEGVTGIIAYGLNKEDANILEVIKGNCFLCVASDTDFSDHKITSVSIDNIQAQYEVAKKTIDGKYCKKVLYLAGKENGFVTNPRIQGILKLQKELGFSLTIEHADFSEKKAREIVQRIGVNSDVIVCASDLMAIGAKNALKEMDIFRPICGFDGITLMGYVGEEMYTVRQDFYHLSEECVKEVKRLIDGEVGHKRLIEHELVQIAYQEVLL